MVLGKIKKSSGFGWALKLKESEEAGVPMATHEYKCERCGTYMTLPFFYCKGTEDAFCTKCEHKHPNATCGIVQNELPHEHFNIMEVKNE